MTKKSKRNCEQILIKALEVGRLLQLVSNRTHKEIDTHGYKILKL